MKRSDYITWDQYFDGDCDYVCEPQQRSEYTGRRVYRGSG